MLQSQGVSVYILNTIMQSSPKQRFYYKQKPLHWHRTTFLKHQALKWYQSHYLLDLNPYII